MTCFWCVVAEIRENFWISDVTECIGYNHQKWLDGCDDCKRSLLYWCRVQCAQDCAKVVGETNALKCCGEVTRKHSPNLVFILYQCPLLFDVKTVIHVALRQRLKILKKNKVTTNHSPKLLFISHIAWDCFLLCFLRSFVEQKLLNVKKVTTNHCPETPLSSRINVCADIFVWNVVDVQFTHVIYLSRSVLTSPFSDLNGKLPLKSTGCSKMRPCGVAIRVRRTSTFSCRPGLTIPVCFQR